MRVLILMIPVFNLPEILNPDCNNGFLLLAETPIRVRVLPGEIPNVCTVKATK